MDNESVETVEWDQWENLARRLAQWYTLVNSSNHKYRRDALSESENVRNMMLDFRAALCDMLEQLDQQLVTFDGFESALVAKVVADIKAGKL
jgi:hypothetical protein